MSRGSQRVARAPSRPLPALATSTLRCCSCAGARRCPPSRAAGCSQRPWRPRWAQRPGALRAAAAGRARRGRDGAPDARAWRDAAAGPAAGGRRGHWRQGRRPLRAAAPCAIVPRCTRLAQPPRAGAGAKPAGSRARHCCALSDTPCVRGCSWPPALWQEFLRSAPARRPRRLRGGAAQARAPGAVPDAQRNCAGPSSGACRATVSRTSSHGPWGP